MKINLPVTGTERLLSEETVIISTTDTKGIITSVNDAFIDISGFCEEELIGKNHNIVRHPDMPAAGFADLWATLKQGKAWMGIVKNRCKNGDHYWVDAYAAPVVENGELVGYQSVRVKPRAEHVQRAEKLYERVNRGKSLKLRLLDIGFTAKAALNLTGFGAMLLLLGLLFGGLGALAALVIGLLSLPLAYTVARLLGAPLRRAAEHAREVVDNPLMQTVYAGRTDEVGQVETARLMLAARLRTMIGRVHGYALHLTDAASSSSAVAEQTAQGVETQHSEMERLGNALVRLDDMTMEMAGLTESAVQASAHADEHAWKGAQVAEEAMGDISRLTEEIERAAGVIDQLSESSRGIGGVLEVINGIAEQTNLLALNAAIEAARAGEAGRGFAVVADEVRTLASRTQASTQEIRAMIERLQGGASEAVSVMTASRDHSEAGAAQVGKTVEALRAIAAEVSTINDMNSQIADGTRSQSEVAAEVRAIIEAIREVAAQTEDGARQSANSAERLSGLALELNVLVRQCSL